MKIVIFGSTGMLGLYVYKVLYKNYEVICINRNEFDILNDKWIKLKNILNNYNKNDIIINCAGIIPQKVDSTQYKEYICINSLFPHKLQEICNNKNMKLIHITTDCVYNGFKGNYSPNDNHTTNTIYGITKSLGEPDEATIIRTSIIGEELLNKKSLLEWIKSNKNNKINGFTNHYWNGVTCLTLAKIIKYIIQDNIFWKGVRHIYSPDIVSKYDLCCYINKIYDLNIDISPIANDYTKNMTLTDENIFNIDNIYNQILELKEFNIY